MAASTSTPPPRLEARGLTVAFGEVRALEGVDLVVRRGEVVGIVGANGAGKTTLLDVICGATAATGGSLRYDGEPWSPQPRALAELGIARTKQDLDLPPNRAVVDVVLDGAAPPPRTGFGMALRSLLGGGSPAGSDEGFDRHAAQLMASLGLAGVADDLIASLSPVQRAHVAVARAAVGNPRLLLLDEPAAGLEPAERSALAARLRALAKQPGRDSAVVIVEHHFDVIERACDSVVVLDAGRVIASGTPDEVRTDARAREVYFA